ncbi:MAG: hypothetical protein AB2814_06845 [Candidatus Sedimenticola endophacoides]
MRVFLPICSGMLMLAASSVSAEYPTAGINPDQRPAGAPTLSWVNHKQTWYQNALTGVSQPDPRSIYFLENQGNWFTPFNHPGMTGPYDIRNWHKN